MYVVKINGVSHTVTQDKDGRAVYDPPVTSCQKRKWRQNINDIVTSGQCPSTRTDTDFHAGRGTLLQQMQGDEQMAKALVRDAKRQGYTPGANDVYIGQMASRRGDPNAWFKPGEGRDELKRRALALNKEVHMPGLDIEAKHVEQKPKALNERRVKEISAYYKRTGQADGMTQEQLKNHVIKTHGRH